MSAEPVITEAELIEGYGADQPGTAMVPAAPVAPTVTPQVGAQELVARLATIREAMDTAMTPTVDYGVIPGTAKPTLLKPGAEKLSALFQLDVQLENEKMWEAPHLTVISHATVFHAPSGTRLGYGEGVCTTRERKYAYRKQERACPNCGVAAVIKGKAEFGGGWLCWTKKGGCNAKWPDGAEAIESQPVGEIENPDLPDLWNTVVKMAEKRARVDAVLAVTGASALFTQDAEDLPSPTATNGDAAPVPAQAPAAQPVAAAVQRTERPATAKQRGLLNVRAAEAELCPTDFANAVLLASGQEMREFDSEEAAEQWLKRALDRLPARLVDPVLEHITTMAQAATS